MIGGYPAPEAVIHFTVKGGIGNVLHNTGRFTSIRLIFSQFCYSIIRCTFFFQAKEITAPRPKVAVKSF